jgi:hypothetical protein
MNLLDFVNDLPEEKRESFKAMAQNALVIANREDAAKYIAEHPHLKSERDAIISRTTDNYAVRFKEEKLPGIMADELKKLNPPKDAKDQALADMQKELADMKRQALLKDRRATALQKLTEAGLPADLADFALDEDENIFSSKLEKLSGLNAWKEAEIKKALTGAVGNQATPKGGQSKDVPKMSLEAFNQLPLADRSAFAKAGGLFE